MNLLLLPLELLGTVLELMIVDVRLRDAVRMRVVCRLLTKFSV